MVEARGERAQIGLGLFGGAFGGVLGVHDAPRVEKILGVGFAAADRGNERAERGEGEREDARGILAAERGDDGDGRRVAALGQA